MIYVIEAWGEMLVRNGAEVAYEGTGKQRRGWSESFSLLPHCFKSCSCYCVTLCLEARLHRMWPPPPFNPPHSVGWILTVNNRHFFLSKTPSTCFSIFVLSCSATWVNSCTSAISCIDSWGVSASAKPAKWRVNSERNRSRTLMLLISPPTLPPEKTRKIFTLSLHSSYW